MACIRGLMLFAVQEAVLLQAEWSHPERPGGGLSAKTHIMETDKMEKHYVCMGESLQ